MKKPPASSMLALTADFVALTLNGCSKQSVDQCSSGQKLDGSLAKMECEKEACRPTPCAMRPQPSK